MGSPESIVQKVLQHQRIHFAKIPGAHGVEQIKDRTRSDYSEPLLNSRLETLNSNRMDDLCRDHLELDGCCDWKPRGAWVEFKVSLRHLSGDFHCHFDCHCDI